MKRVKKKSELVNECIQILKRDNVKKWYHENLEPTPLYDTINLLEVGVLSQKINTKEALAIALLVGIHWNEKPEGCPEPY
jgi:hypothetical protein